MDSRSVRGGKSRKKIRPFFVFPFALPLEAFFFSVVVVVTQNLVSIFFSTPSLFSFFKKKNKKTKQKTGNPAPAYLDGSLPGDYGFDPLRLGSDPEILKWFTHAELIHCRVAMTAVAGILFPAVATKAGAANIPEWFESNKVFQDGATAYPFGEEVFSFLLACTREKEREREREIVFCFFFNAFSLIISPLHFFLSFPLSFPLSFFRPPCKKNT